MFECHSPSTRVAYNPGKRGRTGRVWQLRGSQLFLHTWYQCCHTTATRQAACLSPHMMRMISIEICSLPCMCNELVSLHQQGAAGEIISWVYDHNGNIIDCSLNQHVTSVAIAEFSPKPVIGIAAGEDKVTPIYAAMKSGLITGLITNEYTAKRLLEM